MLLTVNTLYCDVGLIYNHLLSSVKSFTSHVGHSITQVQPGVRLQVNSFGIEVQLVEPPPVQLNQHQNKIERESVSLVALLTNRETTAVVSTTSTATNLPIGMRTGKINGIASSWYLSTRTARKDVATIPTGIEHGIAGQIIITSRALGFGVAAATIAGGGSHTPADRSSAKV